LQAPAAAKAAFFEAAAGLLRGYRRVECAGAGVTDVVLLTIARQAAAQGLTSVVVQACAGPITLHPVQGALAVLVQHALRATVAGQGSGLLSRGPEPGLSSGRLAVLVQHVLRAVVAGQGSGRDPGPSRRSGALAALVQHALRAAVAGQGSGPPEVSSGVIARATQQRMPARLRGRLRVGRAWAQPQGVRALPQKQHLSALLQARERRPLAPSSCPGAQDSAGVTDAGIGTLALLSPALGRLALARLPAVRGRFLAPLLCRCLATLTALELDGLPAFAWAELPARLARTMLHGQALGGDPWALQKPCERAERSPRALLRLRSLRLAGGEGANGDDAWGAPARGAAAGAGAAGERGGGAGACGAAALLALAPALASLTLEGPPSVLAAAARCWCASAPPASKDASLCPAWR